MVLARPGVHKLVNNADIALTLAAPGLHLGNHHLIAFHSHSTAASTTVPVGAVEST